MGRRKKTTKSSTRQFTCQFLHFGGLDLKGLLQGSHILLAGLVRAQQVVKDSLTPVKESLKNGRVRSTQKKEDPNWLHTISSDLGDYTQWER